MLFSYSFSAFLVIDSIQVIVRCFMDFLKVSSSTAQVAFYILSYY